MKRGGLGPFNILGQGFSVKGCSGLREYLDQVRDNDPFGIITCEAQG